MDFRNSDINQGVFWRAVGSRPVGATIVTSRHSDERSGFLGLSFAHVSADPPTVLVSVSKSTSALPTIIEAKSFAVSLLPAGSEAIAREFGGSVSNEVRFAGKEWETLVTGAPVLAGAPLAYDCALLRTVEEGNSVIVLGRVVGVRFAEASAVTLAYRGGYQDF
jgi:flavin reductase (DIM6/NTAB) family NADH-FMN oxidoreductase RutF